MIRHSYWAAYVCVAWLGGLAMAAQSPQDIVIYAGTDPSASLHGNYVKVADGTAAGGWRLRQPDAGAAKIDTALASPTNYVDIQFKALGHVPYRLFIRQKADADSTSNDSVHVQFDHSIDYLGAAHWRIGTADATPMILEEYSGKGIHGWGWQDNGWGVRITGETVIFDTTGVQTIRLQQREDGSNIDQIVLSPTASSYFCASPGAMKDDTTILTQQSPNTDIVLYASEATVKVGPWSVLADGTAAGGNALKETDAGLAKVVDPLASPASYFEMQFQAQAGVEYHLWLRLKAPNTSSDSVHVQFDHSVDVTTGAPAYRIGTGGANQSIQIVLEDGSGAGISNWGWRDSKWGTTSPEIRVKFDTTGTQTIRCQRREDGPEIDQIMLSPITYLTTNPGLEKNDTTILAKSTGALLPADNLLRICEANIHKYRSTAEDGTRPDRTASELALMNANIIGLNEVLTTSGNDTLVRDYLSKMTGVQWYEYFAPMSSGSTQGVAIMSSIPFDKDGSGNDIVSNLFMSNAEGAGRVQITINGKQINFICTHLNADDPTIRATQMGQLITWAGSFTANRVIVGDFNAYNTSEFTPMNNANYLDSWKAAAQAVPSLATAYPDNPPVVDVRTRSHRLDYIFRHNTATNLTLVSAQVPDTRDPNTYSTTNGTNSIGDFLAAGIYKGTPSMILNTHDDKGIRPSDHNWTKLFFSVN